MVFVITLIALAPAIVVEEEMPQPAASNTLTVYVPANKLVKRPLLLEILDGNNV